MLGMLRRPPRLSEGLKRTSNAVAWFRVTQAATAEGDFQMKVLESTHILTRIVEAKRQRLERTKMRVPEEVVKHFALKAPATPSFKEALQNSKHVRVIAEVKKASPSKGVLSKDFSVG